MKKIQLLGLLALLFLSALLGFGMLTRGHNWAYSDFAAYIMQAKGILNGNLADFIAHNTITILESDQPIGPIAYPWGYPLLLTPIISLLGISTLGMKLVNTLFYFLFLISFFFLLQKRLPYFNSLLITALFAFNPVFLRAQDNILSDISFLFFSTFAIFLMDRWGDPRVLKRFAYPKRILIGSVVFIAFFIRTNGLLLLLTLVGYEIFLFAKHKKNLLESKKNLLLLATPSVIFFSFWAILTFIFPDGQASHLSHYKNFQISQLWSHLLFYTNLGESFFAEILYAKLIYRLFWVFFLVGVILKFKENFLFILYFTLTFLLYISWPNLQGIRFLFPILPFFIYLAVQGFGVLLSFAQKISPRNLKFITYLYSAALASLALTFLIISAQGAIRNMQNERTIHGPFDEVSKELFEYIKKNLPEDSLVIFFKPRVMRLMTNRDAILVLGCENLENGDYVVINKKWEDMGQVAPEEIESCPVDLKKIYKNRRFIIYRIGDSR